MNVIHYCQLVGNLIYFTVTRSNIAHIVSIVSKFMDVVSIFIKFMDMSMTHFIMVFTTPLGLLLSFILIQMPIGQAILLTTASSQVLLLVGYFSCLQCSKRQDVVSYSSIEVEYRALANTTTELVCLQWLLLVDMDASQPIGTPIYCDNRSAIHIAHKYIFHERTKCRHCILYHLRLGPPFPNDVEILKPKVGKWPNQIEIDLKKVFLENITLFMNYISYF